MGEHAPIAQSGFVEINRLPRDDQGSEHKGNREIFRAVVTNLRHFRRDPSAWSKAIGNFLNDCGPRLWRTGGYFRRTENSERQIKQAYVDFRGSVECIRAQMSTGEYGAQSYTGAFSRALSLGEFPSPPHTQGRLSWLGPDATLTQCAAFDSSGNVACVFSYSFALGYLSCLTGINQGDYFLISLSEFLGLLCFLIARAEMYRNRLMEYAGDNQNVIHWANF